VTITPRARQHPWASYPRKYFVCNRNCSPLTKLSKLRQECNTGGVRATRWLLAMAELVV
jgi:hypothetical protein